MQVRQISLISIAILTLSACSTVQENPNYQYSTKYKGPSPYSTSQVAVNTQASIPVQPIVYSQTTPTQSHPVQAASYQTVTQHRPSTQTASYTQLDHRCLTKETNHKLIGGAIGGTVGAMAGKKLIGGTEGTLIGGALGGTTGYGIGDKSINCDPIQIAIPHQSARISPAFSSTSQPSSYVVYASSQTQSTSTHAAPTDMAMPTEITQSYGTPGYQAMMGEETTANQAVTYEPVSQAIQLPQTASVQNAVAEPLSSGLGSAITMQYEINQGDTVYSLSRKLCSSVESIKTMNSLSDDFAIKIGDTLKLPVSQC